MGITLRYRTLGLLLALLPATCVLATEFQAASPTPSRAAQFDAVFHEVIGPGSMDMTYEAYEADLQQLRALLPIGDRAREVQFRSVYCGSDAWKDTKQGLAYTDDAQHRAREARDLASQARAQLCRVGYVQLLQGTRQALAEANRLVALLQDSQERQLYGEALVQRGGLLSQLGEQAKALLDFQRARASFREAGIDHEVDALLLDMAIAYRRIGDWTQAERYFTNSLKQVQDKQDWDHVVTDLVQLGYLYDESGKPQEAKTAFERAITAAVRSKSALSVANARVGLASAQISLGEHDAALDTLMQASADFRAAQSDGNSDMLLLLTGQALAGKGQHQEALARYAAALPLIEKDGNQRYLALLYQARAASNEALGQPAAALADIKRYSALQTTLQGKMRLEQSRLLEYEYEIRRREFENRRLRAEADAKQQQLTAMEHVRRWQTLALLLGVVLVAMLAGLSWRQWRRSRQLRILAMADTLTGAASRLSIEKTAERALAQASRDGTPVTLLLLDLDYFKAVNDRYGHAAGDAVLCAAVQAWQEQLRGRDALGRIGGEEFAVVCAGATREQAQVIAGRLLDATRALRLPDIDPELRVGTSIGIAEAAPDEASEALFARADAALYRAKQLGRNRVEY
ncbi:diguanylate cyclase [Thermomonas paludicola]|uniref:diguanylate cyclase n=1 Tax=Thermomonas paludicola TaxID=2884874 RepID=UPI0021139E2F|nr:diguanylate cyclase [Thermomonas paludicola]